MESESESESDWEVIKIPSYDKGAFNGIGDRSNDKYYTLIESPIDIIIFEGWFNGFYSLDPTILQLKIFNVITITNTRKQQQQQQQQSYIITIV